MKLSRGLTDEFKSAEIRVAAFESLTPEQGRALYAAYVKLGLELEAARAERDEVRALQSKRARARKAIEHARNFLINTNDSDEAIRILQQELSATPDCLEGIGK